MTISSRLNLFRAQLEAIKCPEPKRHIHRRWCLPGMAMIVLMGAPASAEIQTPQDVPLSKPAATGCTVTRDDGTTWTDMSVTACIEYYSLSHRCGHKEDRPPVCSKQDMFRAIDTGSTDMIINTHRGVWGMQLSANAATDPDFSIRSLTGAPENSFDGLIAAVQAGFGTVEFDVFLMRQNLTGPEPKAAVVSHFTDLKGFTTYMGKQQIHPEPRGFLMTEAYDPELDVHLRRRDHTIDAHAKFMDLRTFLSEMKKKHPDILLVLDLKFQKPLRRRTWVSRSQNEKPPSHCLAFCDTASSDEDTESPDDTEIRLLLEEIARTVGEFHLHPNIIIKVPEEFGRVGHISAMVGVEHFSQLMWAPQPTLKKGSDRAKSLAYMREWFEAAPRSIAYWDLTIPSMNHWSGRPFANQGGAYMDLTHWVVEVTNRRPAIWTPDPSGPGGRHGNYAMSWEQIGNDENDTRGDALHGLLYAYSANAVVATDRPDLFLCLRNYLKSEQTSLFTCFNWGPAGDKK